MLVTGTIDVFINLHKLTTTLCLHLQSTFCSCPTHATLLIIHLPYRYKRGKHTSGAYLVVTVIMLLLASVTDTSRYRLVCGCGVGLYYKIYAQFSYILHVFFVLTSYKYSILPFRNVLRFT